MGVASRSHKMLFSFVIAARHLLILSLISGSWFPSLVIPPNKYIHLHVLLSPSRIFIYTTNKSMVSPAPGISHILMSNMSRSLTSISHQIGKGISKARIEIHVRLRKAWFLLCCFYRTQNNSKKSVSWILFKTSKV